MWSSSACPLSCRSEPKIWEWSFDEANAEFLPLHMRGLVKEGELESNLEYKKKVAAMPAAKPLDEFPDPQRFEILDFLTLKVVISGTFRVEMTSFRVKKSGISNR